MYARPDFGPLQTREDIASAVRRILTPLLPYFVTDDAGIRLGMESGAQGEPTAALELFSRSLWGLGPLLAGGGHFSGMEHWRRGIVVGTDPSHPNYWGAPVSFDQRQVEQPGIAFALAIAPEIFWEPLTDRERAQIVAWLWQTNEVDIVDSNWRWFRVIVNSVLRKLGEKWSPKKLDSDLARIDEFYLGDGWYRDENRIGDYYIPMAMHHYALMYAKLSVDFDSARGEKYKERARRFAQDFQHWFSADGAAIPFGRSLIYRTAQGSFWGALAFADVEALSWGVIKGLLLRHLRWWLAQPIFSETGLLSVGYRYPNPAVGENYNAYGSPYWALKAFLPLSLPETHPFWQAEECVLPSKEVILLQPLAGLAVCHEQKSGHVFALNQGQAIENWPRHCAHKYGKLAYSTTFGFGIATGSLRNNVGLDSTFALSDDGGTNFRLREKCEEPSVVQNALISTWRPWLDVEVRTWLIPVLPGHLRVHRIRSERSLISGDGGYAIDTHGKGYQVLANQAPLIAAANLEMGAAVYDLYGNRSGAVQAHEPWFHMMWLASAFPVLFGKHQPGETWLLTYVAGWPGRFTLEAVEAEAAVWEVKPTSKGLRLLRDGVDFFTCLED